MYREIETEELVPHPRNRDFDREGPEWEKFAESVEQHGVLQSLLVRPIKGRLEIIMGERRWTAARQRGRETVPCVVRELTDEEAVTLILVENLQRQDLDPIQEAEAVQAIEEVCGDAADVIGRKLGMDPEWVQGRLALLELKGVARDAVKRREIAPETGCLVVQLPLEFREEAVQLVLHPTFQVDPLNHTQAVEMITTKILQPMERRRAWEERRQDFVDAVRSELRVKEPVRCAGVNVQAAKFEELNDFRGADWVSSQFAQHPWEEEPAGTAAVLAARHGAPVMVVPAADDPKRWQAVVNWRVICDAEKALADHLEQLANELAAAEGIEIEEARPRVWEQCGESKRPWLALWKRPAKKQPPEEKQPPPEENPAPEEPLPDILWPLLEEHGAPQVLYSTANWLEKRFAATVADKDQEKIRKAAAEVRLAGQGALI